LTEFKIFGLRFEVRPDSMPPTVIISKFRPRARDFEIIKYVMLTKKDVDELTKFARAVKRAWNKFEKKSSISVMLG